MRRLLIVIDMAMVVLSPVLFLMARLIPKRPGLVLLMPRFYGGFHGNLKYFFLYLAQKRSEGIDPYFLTADRDLCRDLQALGLPALHLLSLRALTVIFRAQFVVVEDTAWSKRLHGFGLGTLGSRKYQLWHGNGIKEVAHSNPDVVRRSSNPLARLLAHILHWYPTYDVMVFSSPSQRSVRARSFKFRDSLINGQPRNDVLSGLWNAETVSIGADGAVLHCIAEARAAGLRIVMYCPTWRPEGSLQPHKALQFDKLNAFAKANGLVIVYKAHPKSRARFAEKEFVWRYAHDADPYPAFSSVDLLVTDYSSIYLDYILLDRPVVFYPYDIEGYVAERGLQRDFDEVSPGPKCHDQSSLQDTIARMLSAPADEWRDKRLAITTEFNAYTDFESCSRLFTRMIEDGLGGAWQPKAAKDA